MKHRMILFLSGLFLTGFVFGQNNGIVRQEVQFGFDPLFTQCIGEDVGLAGTFYLVDHGFATPSGRFHNVENRHFEGVMFSVQSGFQWVMHGTWPVQINGGDTGAGFILNQAIRVIGHPTDDNPHPALVVETRGKFVEDANGEVRVNKFSFEGPSCIGR